MTLSGTIRKILLLLICSAAALLPSAVPAATGVKLNFKPPKGDSDRLQFARADKWKLTGRTLFVKGNVYIPYGNMIIRADEAMVDLESRDVEAKGNISVATVVRTPAKVSIEKLEQLLASPGTTVNVQGIITDPLGNQKLSVEILREGSTVTADRMSGNLLSGNVTFANLTLHTRNFICKARRGIRQPGGELHLENVEVSNCEYLSSNQGHLSFAMSKANIYPHETEGFGFSNMEKERNQYSLWGYNSTIRIYGVPVFWLPMVYAPKDESPGLFTTQLGYGSDWGFYVLMSKKFQLMDYPGISATLGVDYYSQRGWGWGERTNIVTENSRTVINAYGIHDRDPYESSGDEDTGRFEIPHERFDFQITHRTQLSRRLAFRAQVEWMSDPYMLDDFFPDRAHSLTDPASYAALEYQGDRFSASLYARVQVNDFFTTVQKLPEGRLDIPRQEIIPGLNLYYQGSHTADFMSMNWAQFDRKPRNAYGKLKNYETGRFDSVNFLYFPLRTDYFNIVPRAGLRMTGYTSSSRTKLSSTDVMKMHIAADEEDDYNIAVKNYDDRGDAEFRLIAEFGVEANTKIYNTWQNIRSDFLGLDGLRHICEPYVNYTYITDPTVDSDKLLFFDEVDRISEENFIRFGVRNRLQTRRNRFHDATVYEWFSMENYWDIYFNDDENYDYNALGDFCTKFTFKPVPQLAFSGLMSIDTANNQTHDLQAVRGRRRAGRPLVSGNFFNRLYLQMTYKPISDVKFTLAYDYKDGYTGRPAYSMGSTLSEIVSSGAFDQYFVTERTQTLSFGVSMPLTPDRRTFGAYSISYDFEDGGFSTQRLMLSRLFHCIRVSAMVEYERSREGRKKEYDMSFAVYATLVGWELDSVNRNQVAKFSGMD